jgi:hypothetical protein
MLLWVVISNYRLLALPISFVRIVTMTSKNIMKNNNGGFQSNRRKMKNRGGMHVVIHSGSRVNPTILALSVMKLQVSRMNQNLINHYRGRD